jgi:hypothetical protein
MNLNRSVETYVHKRILKNPKKRVQIPQKYIKKRVLRGVNQNPHNSIEFNGEIF